MKRGLTAYFAILLVSLYIGASWNKYPFIKNTVHGILDPTAGVLLQWNLWIGFVIIVAIISLFLMLVQKLFVNQAEMRALKEEQKFVQKEMQKFKDHPEKLLEFQKRQFQAIGKSFNLMTKSFIITAVPIILFFRWFQESLLPVWGSWWILYYLVGAIAFSSLFRKLLKIA